MRLDEKEFRHIPLYPNQMELSIGEKCNLDCDYCFVDKSSPRVASAASVRKAIDWLYSLPNKRYTITFTTMEPFLHAEAWKKAVDYILSEADRKSLEVNIITTTNGLLLDKSARDFIARTDKRLWINISLDGKPETHDAHRPLARLPVGRKPKKSSFELAWENFNALPKDRVRVICTLNPDRADKFRENMDFFVQSGFRHLDLYPNFLTLWPKETLARLKAEAAEFIVDFNRKGDDYDLRLLNRLWGRPYNEKILFGSDEKFYAYEGVLMIPYDQRGGYVVGDAAGVDLELRRRIFGDLFDAVARETDGACISCDYNRFCTFPTPLWLWCRSGGRDFKTYFDNFNAIAKSFIDLASMIDPRVRHWTDGRRFDRAPSA